MAKRAADIGKIEFARAVTPGRGIAADERGKFDFKNLKDGSADGDLLQFVVDATSGEGQWAPLTFPSAGLAAGDLIQWNGTAWEETPMGTLATGDKLIWDGSDWQNDKGTEVIAVGQLTTTATVSATSAASAATVISLGAQTVRAAEIEFSFSFSRIDLPGASGGNTLFLQMWEDSSRIGYIAILNTALTSGNEAYPTTGRMLYTPSAGSKTYSIRGHRSNANCTVFGGAGGTDTEAPGLLIGKYTGR